MNDLNDFLMFSGKIIINARQLSIEAELLRDHGHFKRSTFMSITSYEELMKIYLYLEQGNIKSLYSHKNKFPFLTQVKENFLGQFKRINIDIEKIKAQLPISIENKYLKKSVDRLVDLVHDVFSDVTTPSSLRTRLLYEDNKSDQIAMLLKNEKVIKILSNIYLKLANSTLSDYELLISELSVETPNLTLTDNSQ